MFQKYKIRLKDTDEYLLIHSRLGLITAFERDYLKLKNTRDYTGTSNLDYIKEFVKNRYNDEYLFDNYGHFMISPNMSVEMDNEAFIFEAYEEDEPIFGLPGDRQ